MSSQYLLPCSCGKSVCVSASQAGDGVNCTCGKFLMVPSIRELRKLPEVAKDISKRPAPAKANWSPVQGILFAVGLLMIVIGGGFAIYHVTYAYEASHYTKDMSAVETEIWDQQLDKLTLSQTIAIWDKATKQGLGDQEVPDWVFASEVVGKLMSKAKNGLITVAIGIGMTMLSFVIGAMNSKSRSTKK